MSAPVLAIDPGREKCGIALLAADGAILYRAVVPTAALADTAAQRASAAGARIIMGDGTTSAAAKARMERAGYAVVLVDEYRTTDAARRLYWEMYPPRGWRRFVPRGMLVPPVSVDDLVAVILARQFLAAS